MPDQLAVPVNLANPVERNAPRDTALINEFEHSALPLRKGDLMERDEADDAFHPVEVTDLEAGLAKVRIVADAGQQFVDGLHGSCSWFGR